jgi:DNA-binding MarR family transcriptional regulator
VVSAAANPAPDALAATIVAAIDRLARGRRVFRQAVAFEHGLTPLQTEILATIAAGPPPEPLVGLLARELGVTQPTVTDAVRALEAKGLLQRRTDKVDRRRSVLVLTVYGSTMAERVARADRLIVEAIADAPQAEQEAAIEVLLDLIAHLVDAGVIDIVRTCTTCQYHERVDGRHRCSLLDADLVPATLRLNCPDHRRSARPEAQAL